MVSQDYLGKMPCLRFNWYTESGEGGGSVPINVVGEKGEWLKLEKTITVTEEVARIYVSLSTFGNSGSVWLDDVKVTKVSKVEQL